MLAFAQLCAYAPTLALMVIPGGVMANAKPIGEIL
jgi:hypothetical protein